MGVFVVGQKYVETFNESMCESILLYLNDVNCPHVIAHEIGRQKSMPIHGEDRILRRALGLWDLRLSELLEADTQVAITVSALCTEKVNPHQILWLGY